MVKVGEYHRRKNRLSFKHGSRIIWLGTRTVLRLSHKFSDGNLD